MHLVGFRYKNKRVQWVIVAVVKIRRIRFRNFEFH